MIADASEARKHSSTVCGEEEIERLDGGSTSRSESESVFSSVRLLASCELKGIGTEDNATQGVSREARKEEFKVCTEGNHVARLIHVNKGLAEMSVEGER